MFFLYVFLAIFIAVCSIIVLLLLSDIGAMLFSKVPYCPTPDEVMVKIIRELDIKPNQVICDLGCGDGRFLFAAEKLGAKTIGFEISPIAYLRAQFHIKKYRLKTKVYFKNFYQADLSSADVVFFFLTKKVVDKVEKLLLEQLKKGAVVVIYENIFSHLKPFKIIDGKVQPSGHISKINFYRI